MANTPIHMDVLDIHHHYCRLLPQALAQLLTARIKGALQSSLSPQQLTMIHQFSTAQNLCGMDGGLLVVFGSKAHRVFYS